MRRASGSLQVVAGLPGKAVAGGDGETDGCPFRATYIFTSRTIGNDRRPLSLDVAEVYAAYFSGVRNKLRGGSNAPSPAGGSAYECDSGFAFAGHGVGPLLERMNRLSGIRHERERETSCFGRTLFSLYAPYARRRGCRGCRDISLIHFGMACLATRPAATGGRSEYDGLLRRW